MGVVSEVLGNFGAGHEIEHNGKRYRLSLIDQRVKAAFEKERFKKAREALALVKDDLGPEEYARRLQEKIDLYENGEYEIFSESGIVFIRTIAGMRLLLSLVIDCGPNELMGLILAKKDEIMPLLALVLRESFPGLNMEATQTHAKDVAAAQTHAEDVPVAQTENEAIASASDSVPNA